MWTLSKITFSILQKKYNITNMNRIPYLNTLNFLFNAYWNIFDFFQDLYENTIGATAAIDGILEIKRLHTGNRVFVTKSFTNFLETLINHLKTFK